MQYARRTLEEKKALLEADIERAMKFINRLEGRLGRKNVRLNAINIKIEKRRAKEAKAAEQVQD